MNSHAADRRRRGAGVVSGAILAGGLFCGAVSAAPRVSVELNKLEPRESACQAYLVVENKTDIAFGSLKLDLVVFDLDLIVARRLAVETAPLRGGKTAVKVFPISEVRCDRISRVLLNDVLTCRDDAGDRADCQDLLEVSSRAAAPLVE